MARLGDICTINPKSPGFQDELPVSFVPMPKVGENGEFDPSEVRTYQEVKKGFTYFQNDDVLFAKITPCMENGKGAIAQSLKNGVGFGSTEFHVLRPIPEYVTSKWLFYLLSCPNFRKEAEKNMTGSAGQKRVPKSFLEKYTVDVPDLDTQEKMTDTLDKICGMISLRKQQLAKLDELVKARFVEMFGDPIDNSKRWSCVVITDACRLILGGGTPSKSHPEYFTGSIPWVSPKDMKSSVINDSIDHITEEAVAHSTTNLVPVNSVLMVIRSGILKHTLPVSVNSVPVTINQDMKAFVPNEIITAAFLMHFFKAIERDVLSGVRGVTADNIDFKAFQKRMIIVPPLDLQQQFDAFVEQTDKSKLTIQQSMDKLEELKKALMQEYFG